MPHFIVNNLRQANLSCNCSCDRGKCKPLLPCHSRFNTISAVCAKTWCDESNLCPLSQGDVEGVTRWLTSLKILLDKNLIGPTGEGKRKAPYESLFLFISWLLAFDSDLCLCASGIILLCKVWNGNLWILSGALTYLVSAPSDTLYFFKSKWDWRNRIWVCEPSGLQKIWILVQVQQPRHQCQHPLSFNTLALSFAPLWHIHSAQHMCVCTMLRFSVWLRVWSIWLPVFPQLGSLTLSSVCSCITGLLFPRLHRPLMITEIQYSPNPHTHMA